MPEHSPARPTRRTSTALTVITVVTATLALGVSPAFGDPSPKAELEVIETLTTSQLTPRDIAISPDDKHLFVGFEDNETLSIIDLANGTSTEKQIDTWSAEPILAVPDSESYRLLTAGTNDIYSVVPATWEITAEESPGIEALTYSDFAGKVFSVDGGQQLSERDPLTGELLRWANLDDFYLVLPGLTAHPDEATLYAQDTFGESLISIDLQSVEWGEYPCDCEGAITELSLSEALLVDVAISPDGSALYALDEYGTLFVVSTDDFTATSSLTLTDTGYFPSKSLSVNPVTGEIVAADLNGTVFVIDPTTFSVESIFVGEGLWDTAVSNDGTSIYVTNNWESTISIIERGSPAPAPATNVGATPGARQAAVTWDASTTSDDSLEYTVRAAGSSDVLCATTSTYCIVTGLEPGEIQFTVTATTPDGSATSSPSLAVTITDPSAPASIPSPTPGASIAFVGDQPSTAVIGQPVTVVATGFAPGSYVDVSLHSLPVLIGSGQVGGDGTATISAIIPAGTPTGSHHLVASGFAATGAPASAVSSITLTAASGNDDQTDHAALANTGTQVLTSYIPALGLLLLIGGVSLAASRARRTS